MKNVLLAAVAAFFLTSCHKMADAIINKGTSTNTSSQFVKYTIQKGKNYCDENGYKGVSVSEMKFVVKFDSTAIYQTQSAENQFDINKLYGFSDNDADHHQYSARFGWRWSDNALRLFGYVYNQGNVTSKELATISIGAEVSCSIQVTGGSYNFLVNGVNYQLPRMATTAKAEGYQLYPYFGGDETAPHLINIWIRNVE